MEIPNLRIGTGFDAHAFCEDESRDLIVGGVKIDYKRALAGHSDADVLIHAIVDAILGAMNMGDIGEHFPSSDPRWKAAPSSEFLVWTKDELSKRAIKIVNIDSVIICQEPKMKAYIPEMREKMSQFLALEAAQLSVKATTTDHLGFTGRKEGIAAQAVCLLALPADKNSS